MIDCNIEAIVIKVAALGLDPTKHLGLRIDKLMPHLVKMVKIKILITFYVFDFSCIFLHTYVKYS